MERELTEGTGWSDSHLDYTPPPRRKKEVLLGEVFRRRRRRRRQEVADFLQGRGRFRDSEKPPFRQFDADSARRETRTRKLSEINSK